MAEFETSVGVHNGEIRGNIERFVQSVGRIGLSKIPPEEASFDFAWHTEDFRKRDDNEGGTYAQLKPNPNKPLDDGSAARITNARELVHAAA